MRNLLFVLSVLGLVTGGILLAFGNGLGLLLGVISGIVMEPVLNS